MVSRWFQVSVSLVSPYCVLVSVGFDICISMFKRFPVDLIGCQTPLADTGARAGCLSFLRGEFMFPAAGEGVVFFS